MRSMAITDVFKTVDGAIGPKLLSIATEIFAEGDRSVIPGPRRLR
jgi:hypothetical protein